MLTSQGVPAKTQAIEELKAFIGTERDARQVKKALAVKLIYQDYGYETITGILEVSLGALSKWKQTYERDGLAGFNLAKWDGFACALELKEAVSVIGSVAPACGVFDSPLNSMKASEGKQLELLPVAS